MENSERKTLVIKEIEEWSREIDEFSRTTKYKKMSDSPLVFMRGTNHLFWKDLYNDKRLTQFGNQHTQTWIQGDLHIFNMGIFHDGKNNIIFDVNDFDESFLSDYQYDVWRLATSIALVSSETAGLREADQSEVIEQFAASYISTIVNHLESGKPIVSYFTKDNTDCILQQSLIEAENMSREQMIKKLTSKTEGERHFEIDNKLGKISEAERESISAAVAEYIKNLSEDLTNSKSGLRVIDIARLLMAGTGSLGVPRYYVLIEGGGNSKQDYAILDVKKQFQPSALYYMTADEQTAYNRQFANQAQRQVEAYKKMITNPDKYLGWITLSNGCYSVRERSPYKTDIPIEKFTNKQHYLSQCQQWGKVLANTHIRAASPQFCIEITRLLNTQNDLFIQTVSEVAIEYSKQVIADYNIFMEFWFS